MTQSKNNPGVDMLLRGLYYGKDEPLSFRGDDPLEDLAAVGCTGCLFSLASALTILALTIIAVLSA